MLEIRVSVAAWGQPVSADDDSLRDERVPGIIVSRQLAEADGSEEANRGQNSEHVIVEARVQQSSLMGVQQEIPADELHILSRGIRGRSGSSAKVPAQVRAAE